MFHQVQKLAWLRVGIALDELASMAVDRVTRDIHSVSFSAATPYWVMRVRKCIYINISTLILTVSLHAIFTHYFICKKTHIIAFKMHALLITDHLTTSKLSNHKHTHALLITDLKQITCQRLSFI